MRVSRSLIASLAVTGLFAVGITACGSSNSKSSSGGGSSSQTSSGSGGVQSVPLKPGENPHNAGAHRLRPRRGAGP